MKRYMKKIAVCLLAVTIFTALAGYANANNYEQVSFSKHISAVGYTRLGEHRVKSDESPSFLEIKSNGIVSSYRVQVMGCNAAGANSINCTYKNGVPKTYVICYPNIGYSIQSVVYERSGFVYLNAIGGNGVGANASGYWSADTVQSFTQPDG